MNSNNTVQKQAHLTDYFVYRYLPHNGIEYQAGDKIQLTDKQAKFLTLSGFIGTTQKPDKAIKEPRPVKVEKTKATVKAK